MTFLRLVGLYTRVNELHKLVEHGLHNQGSPLRDPAELEEMKPHTFCTTYLRFCSFPLSAPPSNAALTFVLTFCRSCATSLTFTSDSKRAAQTSLSNASRTWSGRSELGSHFYKQSKDLVVDYGSTIE